MIWGYPHLWKPQYTGGISCFTPSGPRWHSAFLADGVPWETCRMPHYAAYAQKQHFWGHEIKWSAVFPIFPQCSKYWEVQLLHLMYWGSSKNLAASGSRTGRRQGTSSRLSRPDPEFVSWPRPNHGVVSSNGLQWKWGSEWLGYSWICWEGLQLAWSVKQMSAAFSWEPWVQQVEIEQVKSTRCRHQ